MCVSVCKCDECSFFNYCINMDFESVNKDLFTVPLSLSHCSYSQDLGIRPLSLLTSLLPSLPSSLLPIFPPLFPPSLPSLSLSPSLLPSFPAASHSSPPVLPLHHFNFHKMIYHACICYEQMLALIMDYPKCLRYAMYERAQCAQRAQGVYVGAHACLLVDAIGPAVRGCYGACTVPVLQKLVREGRRGGGGAN